MTRFFTRSFAAATTAFFTTALFANNHFEKIADHASKVQRESAQMSQSLKAKKADASEISKSLESTGAEIAKLQELVNQIEAQNPSFSERDRKDWELLKTKVQLLSIFHDRKKELVSGDFAKQRGLIRAHAEGLAKRAALLQQTASRLKAVTPNQAGS